MATTKAMIVSLSLAAFAAGLLTACGGEDGTTPNCPDINKCVQQPDGGTRLSEASTSD